jgi:hypothetical protein
MTMHQIIIRVSDQLATTDQRAFARNLISRSTPGVRHVFMQGGSLRENVSVRREKRRLFIEVPR